MSEKLSFWECYLLFPIRIMEKVAFYFMLIGIPFVVIWDTLVVAPFYFPKANVKYFAHVGFETFVFLNVVGNIYYVITSTWFGRPVTSSTKSKPGWRYCTDCHKYFPPRSYHCRVCGTCTLVRDHHCAFTRTCISFHNYRYFMMTVLHVWFGAVYGVIYHWQHCIHHMNYETLLHLLCFMFPPIAMMARDVTPYGILGMILQLLACVVLLFISFLLITQGNAMIKGQTRHENKHDIETYNVGWKRNVAAVLGTRWYLVWLSPTILSPLPGDGVNFVTTETTHDKRKDRKSQ